MMGKPPGHITARQPWDTGPSSGGDPYGELAISVVLQAVEDYIKALKMLIKGGLTADEEADCEIEKEQLERFFRSQDYVFYTAFMSSEIDGEVIIKNCAVRAKEQLDEERKKEEEKARKQAEKEAKENKNINDAEKAESEET